MSRSLRTGFAVVLTGRKSNNVHNPSGIANSPLLSCDKQWTTPVLLANSFYSSTLHKAGICSPRFGSWRISHCATNIFSMVLNIVIIFRYQVFVTLLDFRQGLNISVNLVVENRLYPVFFSKSISHHNCQLFTVFLCPYLYPLTLLIFVFIVWPRGHLLVRLYQELFLLISERN